MESLKQNKCVESKKCKGNSKRKSKDSVQKQKKIKAIEEAGLVIDKPQECTSEEISNEVEMKCEDGDILTSVEGTSKMNLSPFEKQVVELKMQHPGMILMIQNAYKYCFYEEDAEVASKVLNIIATPFRNFLTASFPVHRLYAHVRRLVDNGYKVGVVNQIETGALKAVGSNRNTPFTRELTQIYTKATLIGNDVNPLPLEGQFDRGRVRSSILSVYEEKSGFNLTFGIAAFDPSTGEAIYDAFKDNQSREELEKRLAHVHPAEILVMETLSPKSCTLIKHNGAQIETLPDDKFNFSDGLARITVFFTSESYEVNASQLLSTLPPVCVRALSALLQYVQQFKLEVGLRADRLSSFTSVTNNLQIDASVLRNLEIFQNSEGGHNGTVFSVIDQTRTLFGSRLLQSWLSQPLRNMKELQLRQGAVAELMRENNKVASILRDLLKSLPDIDNGLTTILYSRCSPYSFYKIIKSLSYIRQSLEIVTVVTEAFVQSEFIKNLIVETFTNLSNVDDFIKHLNENAAREGDKTCLLNDFSEYPIIMQRKLEINTIQQQILELQPVIGQTVGLDSFQFVTVSGQEYLIEVKRDVLVPMSWRKVSETKVVSRYRSPELDDLFVKLTQLREHLAIDSEMAWKGVTGAFNKHYFKHKKAINNLATLDVLLSFAEVAINNEYCRPTLIETDQPVIKIIGGKHPVVSHLLYSGQFIANDTHLENPDSKCMVISGPNMGGKSCYIRQVAAIALMAHIGSFVPANSATISILDAIYIRMGARDDIVMGRSTLLLELQEAATIFKKATKHSLVLIDELGRGTTSCDGAAIAVASLEYLLHKVGCLLLFVTHYPAVIAISQDLNYHMSFAVNSDETTCSISLLFLYKLAPGSATKSYGLNVSKLAGLPDSVIKRAGAVSKHLADKANIKREAQKWMKILLGCPFETLEETLQMFIPIYKNFNHFNAEEFS